MNDQNIICGYTAPIKKLNNRKIPINYFDECLEYIFIDPVILREYNFLARIMRALLSNNNGILYL